MQVKNEMLRFNIRKTTSILNPALPPGLLGSSGGESLGGKWPAPPQRLRGQCSGQWNKIGQARSPANHSALPLLSTNHPHLSLIITLIKSGIKAHTSAVRIVRSLVSSSSSSYHPLRCVLLNILVSISSASTKACNARKVALLIGSFLLNFSELAYSPEVSLHSTKALLFNNKFLCDLLTFVSDQYMLQLTEY